MPLTCLCAPAFTCPCAHAFNAPDTLLPFLGLLSGAAPSMCLPEADSISHTCIHLSTSLLMLLASGSLRLAILSPPLPCMHPPQHLSAATSMTWFYLACLDASVLLRDLTEYDVGLQSLRSTYLTWTS